MRLKTRFLLKVSPIMVSLCMQPLAEITERAQVLVFNNVCMIELQYLQEEKKLLLEYKKQKDRLNTGLTEFYDHLTSKD